MGALVGTLGEVLLATLIERAADEVRASYSGQQIDVRGPADLAVRPISRYAPIRIAPWRLW